MGNRCGVQRLSTIRVFVPFSVLLLAGSVYAQDLTDGSDPLTEQEVGDKDGEKSDQPAEQSAQKTEETPSQLSAQKGGPWWLVGDANIQSVNFRDAQAAFSIGLRLLTKYTDLLVLIRKGTESTLDQEDSRRNFGAFVLAPANTNLGASLQWTWYTWATRFVSDADVDFRWGPTVRLDAGAAKWKYTVNETGTSRTDSVSAYRVTIGVGARSQNKSGNNTVGIIGHLGLTARIIGGDAGTLYVADVENIANSNPKLLESSLRTRNIFYSGFEAGVGVRINMLDMYAEAPFVFDVNGKRLAGLTGGQFVPTVSLRAPIDL